MDVILTPQDVVEPDIVVVTDSQQISKRGIEGAPALVVEVLSPSTPGRDRTLKSKRYEANGVLHYWIVDIEAQRIDCYRQTDQKYTLVSSALGDQPFQHPDWPELQIDPGEIWK